MATQWRVAFLASPATQFAVARLTFHETVQGPDILASASSVVASSEPFGAPYTVAALLDADESTRWVSDASAPQYVTATFASDVPDIAEIGLQGHPDNTAYSPTSIEVQYHNGSTWVTYWTPSIGSWRARELKTLRNPANAADPIPDSTFYKLLVRSTKGALDVSLAEVELAATTGGSTFLSGATATASRNYGSPYTPSTVLDGNNATRWLSGTSGLAGDFFMLFELASPVNFCAEARLRAGADNAVSYNIASFTLLRSANNLTWEECWSEDSIADWTSSELKTFTNPSISGSVAVSAVLEAELETLRGALTVSGTVAAAELTTFRPLLGSIAISAELTAEIETLRGALAVSGTVATAILTIEFRLLSGNIVVSTALASALRTDHLISGSVSSGIAFVGNLNGLAGLYATIEDGVVIAITLGIAPASTPEVLYFDLTGYTSVGVGYYFTYICQEFFAEPPIIPPGEVAPPWVPPTGTPPPVWPPPRVDDEDEDPKPLAWLLPVIIHFHANGTPVDS